MKKLLHILLRMLLVVGVAASVCSCDLCKIKNIDVSSFGIKYIVPTSVNSLSGVLLLGVDNPSMSFTLSDLDGVIKCDGKPILYVTATELPVQRHSVQVYELPCTVTLVEGVSYLDIVKIVARRASTLEGLTADADLHVKLKTGKGRTITIKDLDLSQFS